MSELTFNELMTLHMDAIRSKAGTSEKLSIAAATNAINNLTVSFDFSDATAFTSAQLLAGQKGWDRDGNLVTGTMTNHGDYTVTLQETVQTLDSGFYDSITIPAAESGGGDFDFSNATAFTSSQLLDGQKGYNSNGELITGTLEVSAGGGMEFYECASVESGRVFTGIKITGSTGQDGIYFLEDESATGSARIYKSDNGYNFQYDDMGAIGYRWVLVETGTYNYYATCTLSTSADLTVEEICNNLSWDAYYDTYPVAEVYTAVGDASWSGYKMTWSDGEAGDSIIVSDATESALNGEYTPGVHSYGAGYTKSNGPNGSHVWITYGGWDETSGWVLWEDDVSLTYYVNEAASSDASITEICAGPWSAGIDGTSTIPTFTPSGTPAGWVKADTITEGLTVKGYTPEEGKVYTADTTAVATLYPNGEVSFDFSDATAFTSAQLLSGQKGWDSSGNLVAGSMENKGALNVTLSDQAQTFAGGYYDSITVPAAESGSTFEAPGDAGLYYSEKATLDGTAGALVDFRYKDELIKTITTVTDAEYIYPADNASIMGTENYIHIPDITKLTSDVLKKGETILGVEGAYEGTTTSNVTFGYIKNGSFQAVDLTGNAPTDTGSAVEIDAVTFHTGQNVPDYGDAGGGSSIEFYECATYTPDADAYTKYFFAISGAADTGTNGTYTRTKWVESPDTDNFTTNAKWEQDSGYYLEEQSGYGEFYYYIKDSSGSTKYQTGMLMARVTDYSQLEWQDSDNNSATMTFSAIQTEEVPATTEGWTGRKVTQGSDGAWTVAEEITTGLTVQHLKPIVGTIYSADTTIEVKRMFDGSAWDYVVYAPLAASSTVTDTGQAVTDIGSPTFGTVANVDCAIFSGSDGIKIPDTDIITSGDISICMKVYFNSFNEGALFHIGTASANDLMLFPSGSGSAWSLGTAGGVGNILNVPDTISTNTWISIAVVKSGSSLQFYHDGNMIYESEWGITINKNGFIRIGCGYHNGNDTWFFDGSVAEFMVFNRALSASEVSQLAQQ